MMSDPPHVVVVGQDRAFATVLGLLCGEAGLSLTVTDLAGAVVTAASHRPAAIVVDVDSVPSPSSAISILGLRTGNPVLAVTTPRAAAEMADLSRAGAEAVILKTGGASGLGLLRAGPNALRERLGVLLAPSEMRDG